MNFISCLHAWPIASSGTGTSDYQLQNRYCGGILTDTADAAADFHNSIIGILQIRLYVFNLFVAVKRSTHVEVFHFRRLYGTFQSRNPY